MAQTSEITPILGHIGVLEGKKEWIIQMKRIAISEHTVLATVETELFLDMMLSGILYKNKIAVQH